MLDLGSKISYLPIFMQQFFMFEINTLEFVKI